MDEELAGNESEKNLFISVFRKLSTYKDPFQSMTAILEDLCDFFGFCSGFIYEADYLQGFHLRERHLRFNTENLKESFNLSEYLSPGEIDDLVQKNNEIVYINSRKDHLGERFLELFSAQTLVMVPIIFERAPAAFVGLMDRRHPVRLTKKEINNADAVLSVLAGHVKMRVYQKRLEYTHETMKRIMNNTGVDIYVNDFYTHEILFSNESMAAPYGGVENLMGKRCWEALYTDKTGPCDFCPQKKLVDENGNPTKIYSWDYQRPFDRSWFRVLSTAFNWVDGRLAHAVSSIDITENKYNEELVKKMADSDNLTSLPNRRKLAEDLSESIQNMKEQNSQGYLLFLDLDDFKSINDTMGHMVGDDLLCAISRFLAENKDTVGRPYRYGGDEFVILCENISPDGINHIGDTLMTRFRQTWTLAQGEVRCGASIGAAPYPCGDISAKDIIQAADMAMYEVKKSGKGGFHIMPNPYLTGQM